MDNQNYFVTAMLELDPLKCKGEVLWHACRPTMARVRDGVVLIEVPFEAYRPFAASPSSTETHPDTNSPRRSHTLAVRAHGDGIVRVTFAPADGDAALPEHYGMLQDTLRVEPLSVEKTDEGFRVTDGRGRTRLTIDTREPKTKVWSSLVSPPSETLCATVYPDGAQAIPLMAYDQFFPKHTESLPLAYVTRGDVIDRITWSVHATPEEHFAGTGERFARMDLAGQTMELSNTDALGTNSRRAYKNIPFYLSSRPYGLLVLTTAELRLSLGDISTRAAQGVVQHDVLDLFFIAAGDAERKLDRILYQYRQLTGFPPELPIWSYGTWMSRMSYWTAEETKQVAQRMREGGFPCDVIHLDTGWFEEDWRCDWKFGRAKYPDPAAYMREMNEMGFRISLWQHPKVSPKTEPFTIAREKGYVPRREAAVSGGSNFGDREYAGDIDFTNPEAVKWYQDMLRLLLKTGASVFKTDFGEQIDMTAQFQGMPAKLLHNLYALLYQRANFEVTQEIKGKDQGIIWARSGWVGAQKYPVHWAGDAACTYDGLAGSLRGALHFGLSGFAYWSHDVPGFHGVPDFMNSWPTEDLYLRWTQASVFVSHLRYHGTSPREPYEYPGVADLVRQWLRLRYALIPYLLEQAKVSATSGYPIVRAMVLHHERDATCWHIDDQLFCGENLLVCPILNEEGTRNIYLPEGRWVDLWTGQVIAGPHWLYGVKVPPAHIPVYARAGCSIPVYPHLVNCTDEMDLTRVVHLRFDSIYKGLAASVLGELITL